jgi:uncharacterized repeat protein (TIGR02543 family)
MDTRKPRGIFINVLLVAAILVGMAAVSVPQPVLAGVIYVNDDAPGDIHDGSSWEYAYRDLKNAVAAAVSGDQIWVAAGTYWIASGADTLTLKNGVAIYGGFAGTESDLADRNPNPAANGAKISGSDTDHVVTAPADTDSSCVLDGFTVTGGNADAPPVYRGGGLLVYGSPTLANLLIYKNNAGRAGGMYIRGGSPTMTNIVFDGNQGSFFAGGLAIHNGSPTMDNITFRNNWAVSFGVGGGGMLVVGGSPTLTNAVFSGNRAQSGGGLTLMPVSPFNGEDGDTDPVLPTSLTLTNVVFAANTANYNGGGADITGGAATLTNVTFSGNHANGYGGGLFVENPSDIGGGMLGSYTGSITMVNSIIWGNTAGYGNPQLGGRTDLGANISVSYSDIQDSGGSSAWSLDYVVNNGNNIDLFPFINSGDPEVPGDVDWDGSDNIFGTWDDGIRLALYSPAVDAGDNTAVTATTDIAGNIRIQDGDRNGTEIVDMGAFESQTPLTGIIYVDWSATGADKGTSWADAFTDLQHALLVAESGPATEIWVAAGTYRPTVGTDQAGTFQPRNGVKVYGGFAGYETDLEDRDPATNETILSGDLLGNDGPSFANRGDNSYHVVSAYGWVGDTAVLDGFSIRGGNASSGAIGDFRDYYGGGLYNTGSPTLSNLSLEDNTALAGGGMYIGGGNPTLTNISFRNNHGTLGGGGIYLLTGNPALTNVMLEGNDSASPGGGGGNGGGMLVGHYDSYPLYDGTLTLSNVTFKDNVAQFAGGLQVISGNVSLSSVTFSGNQASGLGGGMIAGDHNFINTYTGNLTLTNVSFIGNTADYLKFGGCSGGGMWIFDASPTLTNVTFAGNYASSGGALYSHSSNPTITNSILWGDSGGEIVGPASVSYSIVQGGYTGAGNKNADPLFVSPPAGAPTIVGDLHLQVGSPAIDAGNDSAAGLSGITTDLDGNNRFFDGDGDTAATVDMGAYEYQGPAYTVTYDGNGGTGGSAPSDGKVYYEGQTVTVLGNTGGLVKTGYSFDGWNTAIDGSGSSYAGGDTFAMGSSNITLYAQWTALPTYSVTYNGNGHTGGNVPIDVTVYYAGNIVTVLGNTNGLVKTGYTFAGWNTEAGGGGTGYKAGNTLSITSNVTLYAQWTINTYTVTYNKNSGDTEASPANRTVDYNTTVGTLPVPPTRTGYTFVNWNTEAGGGGSTFTAGTVVTGDITVYAQWTINTYSVIYDGNGNTGGTAPIDGSSPYEYNTLVTVLARPASLEKTGHAFEGWNTAADGTGTAYAPADTFSITSNVTLYAQWTIHVGVIIYVDVDATGENDGTNWMDAYTDLRVALAAAISGDQIWVAEGIYYFDPGEDTLILKNGVAIYGGFVGVETDLTDRNPDPATNDTVLSGHLDMNTYHVVTVPDDTDDSCVLDGFTITGGRFAYPVDCGGGLLVYGSPTLANLLISGNHANIGAGMYIEGGSPSLTNIVFDSNSAMEFAGGLAIHNGSPTMTDITFRDNKSSIAYGGGGMHVVGGHPTLTGAVFSGNSSGHYGGGLHLMSVSPYTFMPPLESDYGQVLDTSLMLSNVVFVNNHAMDGGGVTVSGGSATLTNVVFTGNYGGGLFVKSFEIYNSNGDLLGSSSGSATVVNAIFWANTAPPDNPQIGAATGTSLVVSYSDVQGSGGSGGGWWATVGVTDGGGNIDVFPFVDSGDPEVAGDVDWDGSDDIFGTWDDGLRLAIGSDAVDAGSDAAVSMLGLTTDILGAPRIQDGNRDGTATVDMGVFESETARIGIIYVDQSATGADNGSSWTDAFTDLQHALLMAEPDPTTQIWVAAGTYLPTVGADRVGSFRLQNNIKLYGGFAGTEEETFDLDMRDLITNKAVLNGDLSGNDGAGFTNREDNSYHVVIAYGWIDDSAVLDGFTISGGNANSSSINAYGGGLYDKGSPTLANLILEDNRAGNGGGIYIQSGDPTLTDITFKGNHAENVGGGIFLISGNPVLTNVTFEDNDCAAPSGGGGNGGGMFVGDYNFTTPYAGTLALSNVIFKDNVAQFAGGMQVLSGNVRLSNVTFSGNLATVYGGGMIAGDHNFMAPYSNGHLTLTDVSFTGNSAEFSAAGDGYFGGGMVISGAGPTLTNVLFSGNYSKAYGGGIFLGEANPTLTNVTFGGNAAVTGGAVYGYTSSPTIINSILWGNAGGEMIMYDGSPSVSYSIVQGGYTGEGNLSADPMFAALPASADAPTTNGDLRVPLDSPAIDAGSNSASGLSGITTDLDGKNRFIDGDGDAAATVDMGAYEHQGTAYHVTYEGNGHTGGSVPTDATVYYVGNTVTILGNTGGLVKTGYSFDGWNTAADGNGTSYAGGDTFAMGSSNVTLYAQWTALPTYSVIYNGNGHTGGSVPTDATIYYAGNTVTVLGNTGSLVKTGYSFTGWSTAANGSGTVYISGDTFAMGSNNVTLYAKWTAINYTVTYNGNANTDGSVPVDATAYHITDTVTVLGNTGSLVKTGYNFTGWNTAANGSGTSYISGDAFAMGSSNVTLYAQWTMITYSVTYDGNSNTGGSVPVDATTYHITDTVTVLGNTGSLVKTGYNFIGWNTAADGNGISYNGGDSFTMGAGNVTLYAKWTELPTYSVTYDGNGSESGSVPIDSNAYYEGDSVTVPGNTNGLVRDGFSFAGWNTAADGTGTSYINGDTFTMGAGDVILYARWSPCTAITHVADSQDSSVEASLTIAKPAGTAAGDLLLVNLIQKGNNGAADDFEPQSTGWTRLVSQPLPGTNNKTRGTVLWKIAGTSDTEPYTFIIPGMADSDVDLFMGTISAFNGVDMSDPLDAVGVMYVGTGNNVYTWNIDITTNDTMLVFLAQVDNSVVDCSAWRTVYLNPLTEIYEYKTGVPGISGAVVSAAIYSNPPKGSTGNGSMYLGMVNNDNGGVLVALKNACDSRGEAPAVIENPDDASITYGGNISFTATAGGDPSPTVQWQVDTGSGFGDISDGGVYGGATTTTLNLTTPPVSYNGYKYQAVFTNGVSPDATSNYATLTVNKATQTITVTASAPASSTYGTTFTVTATGGGSGNPVVITTDGIVCTGSGSGSADITMAGGAGTGHVYFNQDGDDNYFAATQIDQSVAAGKAAQTILVTQSAPASATYGTTFTVTATGGGSGNPVVITTDGIVCKGSGSGSADITMAGGAGTGHVYFNQDGNANFEAAPQVTNDVSAQKASLTITADNTTKTYGETVTFDGTEFSKTGLIDGDDVTSVTLNSDGAAASAGVSGSPYVIIPSGAIGTGLENYDITYVNGELTVNPAALTVTADNQSSQYSDPLVNPLTCTITGYVNGESFETSGVEGTPDVNVALSDPVTEMPGNYDIVVTVGSLSSDNYSFNFVNGTYTVEKENATITILYNPTAVKVWKPGSDENEEFEIDYLIEQADDGYPGDMNLIFNDDIEVEFAPVGGGASKGPYPASDWIPNAPSGTAEFIIHQGELAVECYMTIASLQNEYFDANDAEDVLVVYDPSLGYTTGGGWFEWPVTGEKTNFGYTMKYNKKAKNIQGGLLLIRHNDDDSVYRIKSNALYGLAMGDTGTGGGWASFSGKCIYGWPADGEMENAGGQEFMVYVEDWKDPGVGEDQFWFTVICGDNVPYDAQGFGLDKDGDLTSLGETATLSGGNIVVPHASGGNNRPKKK